MPTPKDRTCKNCPKKIYRDNETGYCRNCLLSKYSEGSKVEPSEQLATDRLISAYKVEVATLKRKYDESLKVIERQEKELTVDQALKDGLDTFEIPVHEPSKSNEGTVVSIASDWHIEENVGPEVGGLNHYNLNIAQERARQYFQGTLRLTDLLGQDIQIRTLVVALLGDFITNDIHAELTDLTEISPVHAIVEAQNFLVSGIEFLLDNSDYDLVFVCHSGNHARTTHTTHFSNENGHSLEYLLYLHLKAYFRDSKRVTFIIPEGYHSYMDIYGKTLRFHHGHAVKYQGGVGGIYIPVNKAIAQWNKARQADLDVFGHFHQFRDGGNFICNGSMIGYNGFAVSIKADYEQPTQGLFLLDKKRQRKTAVWPVCFKS